MTPRPEPWEDGWMLFAESTSGIVGLVAVLLLWFGEERERTIAAVLVGLWVLICGVLVALGGGL